MNQNIAHTATDDFKFAMRRLTATVSIITTVEAGQPFGMAVTAVCSLGVSPPSLLISVAHTASMHGPLMRSRKFAVNILSVDYTDLVGPFSGKVKGPDRFKLGDWTMNEDGVPCLAGAQANLVCDVAQTFEYSGHTVVIGSVTDTNARDAISPLLYENGSFAQSQPVA